MKIAVTYENGQVFQHFGRTEEFKIYNVNDEEIISTEVIKSNGSGHESLAGFLEDLGVNVLICGGIGVGAVQALQKTKIQLLGGAVGEADKQVEDFLNGKIHFESSPSTSCATCTSSCGHHEGEHHCGDEDEEECDGNISACRNL